MKKFEFETRKQDTLTIVINDKTFTFNPLALKVRTAAKIFLDRQKPMNKKFSKGDIGEDEVRKLQFESCKICKDTINSILGKNAYNLIFAERTMDYIEHHQVIAFIFDSINGYDKSNNK